MFRQPQLFLSIFPRNSRSSFANNHTRRSSSVSLVSTIVANRKNSGSTILGGSALSSHFTLRCAATTTATTASTDGGCTKRTFATTTTPTNTSNTHYANRRDMPFQHFSRGRRSNTIHYPPSPQSTIGTTIDGGGQEEQEGVILPTQKFKIPRKRASKLFHELNVEKCEENRQRKPDVFQVPFRVGDAIEVTQVSSGGINSNEIEKIRGVVLGKRNRGLGSVFYLRDVLFGEPIERIIPLHSPMIQKIEILQHNFVKGKEGKKIKRAKLFYLRNRNPALCRVTKEA